MRIDRPRYRAQHRLPWLTRRKSPGKICRRQAVSASLRLVSLLAAKYFTEQYQYLDRSTGSGMALA
jgi:hypothetical protein